MQGNAGSETKYEFEFIRGSKWYPSFSGKGTMTLLENDLTVRAVRVWGGQSIYSFMLLLWILVTLLSLLLAIVGTILISNVLIDAAMALFEFCLNLSPFVIIFGPLVAYFIAMIGFVKTTASKQFKLRKCRIRESTSERIKIRIGSFMPTNVTVLLKTTDAQEFIKELSTQLRELGH